MTSPCSTRKNTPMDAAVPTTIKFSYIKSNYFRVIHVDGGIGGFSSDKIVLNLYSERGPIPKTTTHELGVVKEEGGGFKSAVVGKEIPKERECKDGLIREIEVGLTLSVDSARRVRDWLSDQIERLEAQGK